MSDKATREPRVGELWRVKETGGLVVIRPSVEGVVTSDFGGHSDGFEDFWTFNDFMRGCEPTDAASGGTR